MYRSVPKDFIVPVRFMRKDEKNLFDITTPGVRVNIDSIKDEAEKLINSSLTSLLPTLKKLNRAQLEDIILSAAKEFIKYHLDNFKCVKKIISTGFNGMSIDQILNMHLDTIRSLFNFHFNGFSCGKDIGKGLRSEVYKEFKDGFLELIKGLLEKLNGAAYGITIKQVEDIGASVLSAIFNWLVKNVTCFKNITKERAEEVLKNHIDKFKKIFAEHLQALDCK